MYCTLNYWSCRFFENQETWSISSIIVRTDNQHLNQNVTEGNRNLLEFCKEMNLSIIDISKRIKTPFFFKSKLHLNKKVSRILRDIYHKEMAQTFNPFVFNAPFLYPLKRSENREGFLIFSGGRERVIGNKWVNWPLAGKNSGFEEFNFNYAPIGNRIALKTTQQD